MPRTNVGGEVLLALRDALLTARVYREVVGTHGSTTISTATAIDDPSIAVAAVTNFSDLDPIIIRSTGGDELNQINDGGAPASPLALLRPTPIVHPIGATVVEAVATALGHITLEGIALTASAARTPVQAATQVAPLTTILEPGTFGGSMGLKGFNILNWQFATGTPESEIGAGTAADPYQGIVVGPNIGTQPYQVLRIQGVRDDSNIVEVDLHNCQVEISSAPTMNRGADNNIPVSFTFTSAIMRHWAP